MSPEVTRQRLKLGLGLGLGLGYQVNKILNVTVPVSKRLPGLSDSVLVPTTPNKLGSAARLKNSDRFCGLHIHKSLYIFVCVRAYKKARNVFVTQINEDLTYVLILPLDVRIVHKLFQKVIIFEIKDGELSPSGLRVRNLVLLLPATAGVVVEIITRISREVHIGEHL